MQNGAPSYIAKATIRVLDAAGIDLTKWPPFSPETNPIEFFCYSMKGLRMFDHPEVKVEKRLPIIRLKNVITEAWNPIPPKELGQLIAYMPARCQTVPEAERGQNEVLIFFYFVIILCLLGFCLLLNLAVQRKVE